MITWSNSQLQALTKAHDSPIQDYKCAEWQSQEVLANAARQSQEPDAVGRAPAALAADQVPQVTTPRLIPPLNQLARLSAVRAHGENAENAQEGRGSQMLDQRLITRQIMREWQQHKVVRDIGAPNPRCAALHQRHASQKTVCISRTVVGQHGHSLLQNSMPDEEERDCAPNKRKTITWTPDAFLNSLGHDWGFSINEGFTKEKVQQDLVT